MPECVYILVCKNNAKCLRCNDYSLKKIPGAKTNKINKKSSAVSLNKDKPWEALEKNIVNMLNEKTRRTRASGSLPYEKGDVLDDIAFIECKSRSGNSVNKGADKSFTILKSWLVKAGREALTAGKPLIIPFQFAGHDCDHDYARLGIGDKIYAIMDMDELADLIALVKCLRAELNDKEKIINELKR